ncbi:hypothetical protein HYS95_02900 [Candidatus Daviesbacteria bacterium]|nr:hypothetical protein [Candidatus Daviesbacteria bacterium]
MQKGSAHLLLILLSVLVISVAAVFFYTNQNKAQKFLNVSPVASVAEKKVENQQPKYSDADLGFEFTYSKDLTVKKDSEEEFNKRGNGDFRKNFKGYVGYEPAKFLGAATVLEKNENFETNPFSIWVFENLSELSIDKWFDNYWYYPFVWGVFDYASKTHIALEQEATISGQPAKSKVVSYQPGKPKFVYISKDQKMYLFRIIGEEGERILSTFNLK